MGKGKKGRGRPPDVPPIAADDEVFTGIPLAERAPVTGTDAQTTATPTLLMTPLATALSVYA